jgi:hypothetical protein
MTTPAKGPAPLPAAAPARTTFSIRAAHPVEELLHLLGAESPLAHDLVGDLVEEYALRRARDGATSARWWYARQAACAVPHLLWSAVRHGQPAARTRLVASLAAVAFASLAVVVAVRMRAGPAVQLVGGVGSVPNQVVVSTVRPVKIPVRVLDASGRVLPDSGVRYAWEAGAAASVSPDGVARCVQPGEATVRATLGALATRVRLSCQPVRELRMKHWYNFVVGDPAQELHVGGYGLDGKPVTRIAATVSVDDDRIAALDGKRVRPLAPGRTFVTVSVGERWARAAVTVFEPVRSLARLREDQHFVIAPVRLDPGEAVRWPLPEGAFWLVNQVDDVGDAPALDVSGPVACTPAPAPGVYRTRCVARAPGARVTLSHPRSAASPVDGALALERDAPGETRIP